MFHISIRRQRIELQDALIIERVEEPDVPCCNRLLRHGGLVLVGPADGLHAVSLEWARRVAGRVFDATGAVEKLCEPQPDGIVGSFAAAKSDPFR